ncbi:MAG: C_GCAxxG_C_C family protein [Prolixibacteraceae bacterium]|nr:C_GCAxxG_C_C family protein [Prolixibacteraceae bacterium]
MKKSEKAAVNFKTMNCNQSVLAVFGPDFGVSEDLCFNLGLGYGGGIGREGRACGACTGAYTAIGLWAATKSNDSGEQKNIAALKVQEYNRLFIKKYNHLDCKDLLGYNMAIPEEKAKITELNLHQNICVDLVRSSAEILTEILD